MRLYIYKVERVELAAVAVSFPAQGEKIFTSLRTVSSLGSDEAVVM